MISVCIITGAGHKPSIGYQSAMHFINCGYRVITISRSFDQEVKEQYQLCGIELVEGDVNDPIIQDQLVKTCQGRLDLLVHSAMSTNVSYTGHRLSRTSWVDHLQTGVISIYELTLKLQPLLEINNGCVITLGSRSALVPGTGNNIAYGVTKAAVISLTKELAVRLAPGVRVNCVSPGMCESQRLQNIFGDEWPNKVNSWTDKSSLKRLVSADDIVSTIDFLANNKSITAANVVIDCGISPEIS